MAYVDWSHQEFGIAAALSRGCRHDGRLRQRRPIFDIRQASPAPSPSDATKHSHPQEREQFKVCALAVQITE